MVSGDHGQPGEIAQRSVKQGCKPVQELVTAQLQPMEGLPVLYQAHRIPNATLTCAQVNSSCIRLRYQTSTMLFLVHGGWSDWTLWSSCSVTCDIGNKTRTRTCDNPAMANGGVDCDDPLTEDRQCNVQLCPPP